MESGTKSDREAYYQCYIALEIIRADGADIMFPEKSEVFSLGRVLVDIIGVNKETYKYNRN